MSKPRKRTIRSHVRYLFHAGLFYMFFYLFKSLSIDTASALGGALTRFVGPWLRVSRVAQENLVRVFPDRSSQERQQILLGMWENIGRVLAESPHIREICRGPRIVPVPRETIQTLLDPSQPKILVSAHIGNWELLIPWLDTIGLPVTAIYRRPNNPYVEKLFLRTRHSPQGQYLPKGREGTVGLVTALQNHRSISLLVDQRYREGLDVTLCGFKAMTVSIHAKLALRFGYPLIVGFMERLQGAWFRVTWASRLVPHCSGNIDHDTRALTQAVNDTIEIWIRKRPEHWLWLHRRWRDD